jgi:F-type H+-transporting ATPase subunit a
MSDVLADPLLLTLGPVRVTTAVVHTWGLIALLTVVAWLGTRHLAVRPGPWQTCLEWFVETAGEQIRQAIGRDPQPYLPLLASLFLFISAANTAEQIPGLSAPTARPETTAALAALVFLAVHAYGIRAKGLWGHLRHYADPHPLFIPFHLISELGRTFSMMVRLAGNIMGHGLVIGILLALAGLILPVPLLALGLIIGFIQAYIFTMLALVFVGAAVEVAGPQPPLRKDHRHGT